MAKSRQRASHQRYQQRAQRTVEIRQKRRGTDEYEEARKIKKVVAKRPLPSDEDKELLLHQFKEACRLPLPCVDLCALLQVITEKKEDPSNLLAEVTRAFLELPTTPAGEATEVEEGAEVTTVLEEMLQTDGGRRVAVSLLAALSARSTPNTRRWPRSCWRCIRRMTGWCSTSLPAVYLVVCCSTGTTLADKGCSTS
ncbi:hypothetical protein AGDE_13794 [Angomonas deanei]|nr:hypothetical protein AGDE_13794 [Angomonas deanei]|eukprot:EPY21775.1 hypothetical protein AGDE_13794 [Angomonas deanei]